MACPGRRTGRARARGHGGDWGLHFIEPRAGVDVLEDRSNALSRHGVGISRGYLLPKEKIKLLETRRWKRAKMSSKGDQESTRRGPLPHKYHKPAPARVWGKLLGVASKSRDGSCQRGGDQPPRSCPSALAGQNVAGPRHKGNVQRVGKSGGLPAFWPLVGVSTSASGRYCYAGPAGRCGVVQRWGGGFGVRLWGFAGAEAEGKTRLGVLVRCGAIWSGHLPKGGREY